MLQKFKSFLKTEYKTLFYVTFVILLIIGVWWTSSNYQKHQNAWILTLQTNQGALELVCDEDYLGYKWKLKNFVNLYNEKKIVIVSLNNQKTYSPESCKICKQNRN